MIEVCVWGGGLRGGCFVCERMCVWEVMRVCVCVSYLLCHYCSRVQCTRVDVFARTHTNTHTHTHTTTQEEHVTFYFFSGSLYLCMARRALGTKNKFSKELSIVTFHSKCTKGTDFWDLLLWSKEAGTPATTR
jgi:hypothetical protein